MGVTGLGSHAVKGEKRQTRQGWLSKAPFEVAALE